MQSIPWSKRNLAAATVAACLTITALGCSGAGPSATTTANTQPSSATTPPAPPTAPPSSPIPPSSPAPSPQSSAQLNVNIGDAPADRVLSFEVTVTSIVLTQQDGTLVNVFTGSRRIEVVHLAGTVAPIALAQVPQGTFTKVDITVTDPEVSFLGQNNGVQTVEQSALTRTVTIPFNPPLTVSTSAAVLNIDLNAAASVLLDPTTGSVTINPTLTAAGQAVDDNSQEPESGELDHIAGTVTAVDMTAGSFTISAGESAVSMTFATSTDTKFEIGDSNNGGLGSLAIGMLVRVDGSTQADGSLLASEVEALATTSVGSEGEGVVTSTTGNPVTQFTFLVQDGNGGNVTTNTVGSIVTIMVDNNTRFTVDANGLTVDNGLFDFDAAHLSKGQRVEADSESGMESNGGDSSEGGGGPSSGSLAADKVKLQQQALEGTVSNFTGTATQGQFTLTVDADSAFAILTGQSAVTVFTQSGTGLKDNIALPPASDSDKIRVRGLLFFDGTGFQMLAARVSTP